MNIADAITRLGPVFAAIFLMLVVGIGVILVAYSTWQLVKMRREGRHARAPRSR